MRNSRWTTLLAVAGALLALLTLAAGAAAQATPLPLPATPNPAECAVKPRTIAEMRRLAAGPATPPAVPPIIGPRPYTPPSGTPADAATVAAVTATMRELYACLNGGNPLAAAALMTPEWIAAQFSSGTTAEAQLRALPATPQPLPPQFRIAVRAVRGVRVLPDGRVGAIVEIVLGPRGGVRDDWVVFAAQGGRWLIDGSVIGIHGEGLLGATPAP